MSAAWIGYAFAAAVFGFMLAAAAKAQGEIRKSGYMSMLPFGLASQLSSDRHELQRFGLAQLLNRRHGHIASMGASFNAMGLIGSAAVAFGPALQAGGPSTVAYGLPVIALLSAAVGASLAGLASAVPTAGGAAHAAFSQGGRKWGNRTGYYLLFGHTAMLSLYIGACTQLADGFAAARFGYGGSSVSFWILAAAVAASQAAANHWGARWSSRAQAAGVWLQLGVGAVIVGGLAWTFWPDGSYSSALLYQWRTADYGGEATAGGFMLGALLLLKLFAGMDGAAHGAEETVEPRTTVPWSIFLSVCYTFAAAFVLYMFMALVLPSALPAAGRYTGDNMLGMPGVELFLHASSAGWGGAPLIDLLVLLCLWCSGTQSMAVVSRALFSMARDEAVPLRSRLSAVSVRHWVPAWSIWSCAAAAAGVLAASAAGGAALPALLSVAVISLHIAYAVPIGLKLGERLRRLKSGAGGAGNRPGSGDGPWRMGRWGLPLNAAAFVWLIASSVLTAVYVHSAGLAAAACALALSTAAAIRYRHSI